jgi:alpha-tubulin suppressor-like RCC1 family protein
MLSGLAVGAISYGSGQPTGWLSATVSSGTAPATLTLRATIGSLTGASYTATVPVTSGLARNSPQTVTVTLIVGPPPPAIVLSPSSISFVTTYQGANPAPQTVSIANGGSGTLSGLAVGTITYGSGQPTGWLSASLSGSAAPAVVTLTATLGLLRPGTYTATVPVASGVASNSPQTVGVTFNVMDLFSAVSAGWDHSCGKGLYTAVAFCWGDNASGELGIGTTTGPEQCTVGGTPVPCSTKPVAVGGGLTFYTVSAGNFFTCGVSSMAYCWGDNTYGQLGNGSTTNSSTPVAVAGGLGLSQISVGDFTVCGLVSGGIAYCWGDNTYGQLGNGSTTNSSTPVAVAGGLTFSQVSAGASSCGITTAGTTFCWGSNASGQLGIGTTTGPQQCSTSVGSVSCSTTPVAVAGGLIFQLVSAGGDHTCANLATGTAPVYCWGDNTYGQLGDGTTTSRSTPVAVTGAFVQYPVSAGYLFTCSVSYAMGGTRPVTYCWGNNSEGELGDSTTTNYLSPVVVGRGMLLEGVSAGRDRGHACGIVPGGAAYCWGKNSYGELGDGTMTSSVWPVKVFQP